MDILMKARNLALDRQGWRLETVALALSWPPLPPRPRQIKKCFKKANTVDTGTKFIIRDTA